MVDRGRSITTVGIYLCSLRVILNLAKSNGIIRPEDYPFGRGKYVIPTGKNIKKALSKEEIKKIFEYPAAPGSPYERAKDFWLFSYLCNGINIADIALLKWSDVSGKTIVFERTKTKRTKRNNPIKIVALRDKYKDEIIKKWGCLGKPYLFGIIKEKDSPEMILKRIVQFVQTINKWMKRIGEDLKLDLKLTTYVASHSFATILVRGGAPLEMASQLLGHSSLQTTQRYFAGFDLDKQLEYTKALTDF